MRLSCPEQPGCHSSAQHQFSKFHFYLQESRAPQNSSRRLKLFTELQGSELPYSEDGSAQLLKNILKPHNYLIKGIKVDIVVCIRCTLLITTSSTDVNVLFNSTHLSLSGFTSSITAENADKRRHHLQHYTVNFMHF